MNHRKEKERELLEVLTPTKVIYPKKNKPWVVQHFNLNYEDV